MLGLCLATDKAACIEPFSKFDPASLFTGGFVGIIADPNDLTKIYQTNDTSTPVTTDGQSLGRVTDKSSGGNHLVQATAGNRPVWRNSGGIQWIDFTTDFFNITNCTTLLSGWTAGTALFAEKLAVDPPVATAHGVLGFFSAAAGGDVIRTTGNIASTFLTSAQKDITDPGNLAAWAVHGVRSTNGDFRYEFNGVEALNTATNTFQATTGNANFPAIGNNGQDANYLNNASVGRILIINRILNATEMAQARTWVGTGVGVAV